MAQRTVWVDDLDGSTDESVKPLRFSVNDTAYEIDLTEANQQRFHAALKEFTDKARKVERPAATTVAPSRPTRRRASSGTSSDLDFHAVREWAKEQGLAVSDRGRIAQEVIDKYRAAHGLQQQAATQKGGQPAQTVLTEEQET